MNLNISKNWENYRTKFWIFLGSDYVSFPAAMSFVLMQDSASIYAILLKSKEKRKLRGFSPQANYIDRATAACRRSECQL
jgi:hypothetical protein